MTCETDHVRSIIGIACVSFVASLQIRMKVETQMQGKYIIQNVSWFIELRAVL